MSRKENESEQDEWKKEELGDLHLRLSEKYMLYRELAERCFLNPQSISKGERRVFYLEPQVPFLMEPRIQNQFRHDFVDLVGQLPFQQPLTLMADELQRSYLEKVMDRSNPDLLRKEFVKHFKRRQYKLQHKRYKLMHRWAHHCLTSDRVDQVSLSFNAKHSKIQMEMENCVKRVQRLEGRDHFLDTTRPRPADDMGYEQDEHHDPISVLRLDDIDVYLRQITYEEKITRSAERLIQKAKWLPLSHRYELYKSSVFYFQRLRKAEIDKQQQHLQDIHTMGEKLAIDRGMATQGEREIKLFAAAQHHRKVIKKQKSYKDAIMNTAKSNYQLPPMIFWNELDLKIELNKIATAFGVSGDLEIDNGHSFQYTISVYFPTEFSKQTNLMQFAPYDVVQQVISDLNGQGEEFQKSLSHHFANSKKRSIKQQLTKQELREIELIEKVENNIFGELNNVEKGQENQFPLIRIKKSIDWIQLITFQPDLDKDQKYQASLLSGEKNKIDACLKGLMTLVDIQECSSTTVILETLAKIHAEKVRTGRCVIDFNDKQEVQDLTFFTEDEKTLLSLFQSSMKTKSDFDDKAKQVERNEISFFNLPKHLLSAMNLLVCLRVRNSKIKLMHTLNAFRSIQRRMTLDLREMGTRDRALGDVRYLKRKGPFEGRQTYVETDDEKQRREMYKDIDMNKGEAPKFSINDLVKVKCAETIDITHDGLVDINKYRFDRRFHNLYNTTCPITPVYHQTFGQPTDRQELSDQFDISRFQDVKKDETAKLVGRADKICIHQGTGLTLVKDDFDVNILYDATFLDVRALEEEVLKICSFYINKLEPLLDRGDLTNIYPGVDRFRILDEALSLEAKYQEEKLKLVLTYVECYEHVSDILCQQRMIQVIVDEMAKRPRLNLQSTHFRDSFETEIACMQERNGVMRDLIKVLMKKEFEENTMIREYIEKTYRLLHDQMENKWTYVKPEKKEKELNKREQVQTGAAGTRDAAREKRIDNLGNLVERTADEVKEVQESVEKQTSQIFQTKFADPKEFANFLGMPYQSLQMLMKEHHERDPLVRTAIHEHVSFIKIQEGYPQFIYKTNLVQNLIKFNQDSESIGLLDFYESFHVVPRILSSIQLALSELNEVHAPDNGLMTAALELCTLKELRNQLRLTVEDGGKDARPAGIEKIEDDEILGNSDKMLFYSKELRASAEDEDASHNPFVISKLDLQSIEGFSFERFQGYIDISSARDGNKDSEYAARKVKVDRQSFGRFYPALKEHSKLIKMPSLLTMSSNTIEVMRLRHQLLMALEQAHILRQVYKDQVALLRQDLPSNFREPFKFGLDGARPIDEQVNFVEEGPAHGLRIELAINEFDDMMASSVNFSDSECFKATIIPLGLEELRCVVQYEIVNLQALIVAVRTNQALLDNTQRRLCEIEFFEDQFTVPNPVLNLQDKLSGTNLLESNLKKLPAQEKLDANSRIVNDISPLAYSILARKSASKQATERQYAAFKDQLRKSNQEKTLKYEVEQRILRSYRMYLCLRYSQDVQIRICHDSIKLQLLVEVDRLRKRSHLLPREARVFSTGPATSGEHEFAAYHEQQEEGQDTNQISEPARRSPHAKAFFDSGKEYIVDVWRLPSNEEIINLRVNDSDIHNMNPIKTAQTAEEIMASSNMAQQLQKLLPTLTPTNDSETMIKNKGRLVHFKEALDYDTIAFKYLRYWRAAADIFDLEFFINKLSTTAFTIVTAEKLILSGLPFWDDLHELEAHSESSSSNEEEGEVESSLKASPRTTHHAKPPQLQEGTGKEGQGKASSRRSTKSAENEFAEDGHKPLENVLANQVAEKMAQDRREKIQLLQDLETVAEKLNLYKSVITQQEMTANISRAIQFLRDTHKITYLSVILTLHQVLDHYLKEGKCQREVDVLSDILRMLTHTEDLKVTLHNGFHVDRSVSAIERLDLEVNVENPEYTQFFKATQPIIDEEALNPPEYNLIKNLFDVVHGERGLCSRPANFMGSLRGVGSHGRVYSSLDFSMINLHRDVRKYAQSNQIALEGTLRAFVRQKNKHQEEADCLDHPSIYSQMMEDKLTFLRSLIRQRQLKRVYMMMTEKRTVPRDVGEFNRMSKEYQDFVNWKLMQQHTRKAKWRDPGENKVDVGAVERLYGPGGSLKVSQDQAARRVFLDASAEVEIVQHEIQKYMIHSSLELMRRETDALAKAFEMSNIGLQAHIHPVQQFASTFEMEVDNRNHLDIINKVPAIQKMYTQINNRSLEVQTLTSGVGVVITRKDLNESLDECCRSLVQFSEIEMRSRCEHMAMYIAALQEQLYIKDRHNEELANKLQLASRQMDKIVGSRMFSSCKNLVYELDQQSRQLRFMKDSIFMLEKNLTDKIHLCYDKELEKARAKLKDLKTQFNDYQDGVSANIKQLVRKEVNTIDKVLKQTASKYQNLEKKTAMQLEKERFEDRQRRLRLKPKGNPIVLESQLGKSAKRMPGVDDLRERSGDDAFMEHVTIKKQRDELENLKAHEEEARESVIRLQELLRKQRMMQKMREVVAHEKHLLEIDHLKKQLTENQELWDKLSEGENREKILKAEIERTHQQIANQDKVIDKLKDELKRSQRENLQLIQYKQSQSKRLGDLEEKARDLEILQGLDIQKLLGLLEKQDRAIEGLKKEETKLTERVGYLESGKEQDAQNIKRIAKEETKYKIQALQKLEALKSELSNPQSTSASTDGEPASAARTEAYWHRQTQVLFDLCLRLKDEITELRKENMQLNAAQVYASAPVPATPLSTESKLSSSVDRLHLKVRRQQEDSQKGTAGGQMHLVERENGTNVAISSQRFRNLNTNSTSELHRLNPSKLTSGKITVNSRNLAPLSGQTMYQTLNMHPAKSSVFFRGPTTTLTSGQKLPTLDKRSKTRERVVPAHQNFGHHAKLAARPMRGLQYDQAAPYDSICSTSLLEGDPRTKILPTKLHPKHLDIPQKKHGGANLFSSLQKNSLFSAGNNIPPGSIIEGDMSALEEPTASEPTFAGTLDAEQLINPQQSKPQ